MTQQRERLAEILARKPREGVTEWLAELDRFLDGEAVLEAAAVAELLDRGRPRWGARTAEDGAAYVTFWERLVQRHDLAALQGGYSDVLLLLGPRDGLGRALDVYLAAARRDADVFVKWAADFASLAGELGRRGEYELVMLGAYAEWVRRGTMTREDFEEAAEEMRAEYAGDAEMVAGIERVASGTEAGTETGAG